MRGFGVLLVALALGACTVPPQRAGVPSRWLPSPNYDERRPNFVVLHHTGSDDTRRALQALTDRATTVSAHYLVARDGTIWQLVDERARAWHAGASSWGGSTDLNSASIGIELDNDGEEPYADAQIAALIMLLRDVTARNRIPTDNVLGHGDIAPRRKVDPGPRFPWKALSEHGFGPWCEVAADPAPLAPADLPNALLLLQVVGYDTTDAEAAIAAFRRHFRQDDAAVLDRGDLALLRCLVARRGGA